MTIRDQKQNKQNKTKQKQQQQQKKTEKPKTLNHFLNGLQQQFIITSHSSVDWLESAGRFSLGLSQAVAIRWWLELKSSEDSNGPYGPFTHMFRLS